MKEVPFLNTSNKAKSSFLAPFTSKIADLHKDIRVRGAEKQAVSLRKGSMRIKKCPEKWLTRKFSHEFLV